MPVCQGCGGSYDDQFKFCPYCGRSKPEPTTINLNVTSDDIWETCEINLVCEKKQIGSVPKWLLEMNAWFFEATAIGVQGKYAADHSQQLDLITEIGRDRNTGAFYPTQSASPKLNALIKKLVLDGWQPIGRGQEWYSERFRRKVKK
jgi:hypothetical protein